MPLVQTRGAASAQGFGEFAQASGPVTYIEDVFSTYLYTGNGSNVTLTNGINLSGKGGLTWFKNRSSVSDNFLYDTLRPGGATDEALKTNSTAGTTVTPGAINFLSTGVQVLSNAPLYVNGDNYVCWTFRKQPKFFDVVTWTGTNSPSSRLISHSLGSQPGHIMMKRTDAAGNWSNWHIAGSVYREFTPGINSTASLNSSPTATNVASSTSIDVWYTQQTSGIGDVNGATYVAYLFAHNAGGFGLTGTDNVISCGSFTTDGSGNATVSLGYEPQWVLYKRTSSAGSWLIIDNMRGNSVNATNNANFLLANTSDAEGTATWLYPTATGFTGNANSIASTDFIYIAIRRGPMKVPTVGTSVFSPTLVTGNGTNDRQITGVGFPPDLLIGKTRSSVQQPLWYDKLRGKGRWLESSNTLAEQTLGGGSEGLMLQDGFVVDFNYGSLNSSGITYIGWVMRRAPSFFDEVCYTGTGVSGRTVTHNLGVPPELMFVKSRSAADGGLVYNKTITASKYLELFFTGEGDYAAQNDVNGFTGVEPTSSVFTVGSYSNVNGNGSTYVAYLFATCPGVSKVGTYTGTGTTLQIDCGFTAGARFVLIKRTSSPASGPVAGGWFVWDSARGIVSGNDPYLLLNTTAAEVTGTDYVDTYSAGFEISSTAPIQINESAKTYIFLAIA
jgi:hypothetical protein